MTHFPASLTSVQTKTFLKAAVAFLFIQRELISTMCLPLASQQPSVVLRLVVSQPKHLAEAGLRLVVGGGSDPAVGSIRPNLSFVVISRV